MSVLLLQRRWYASTLGLRDDASCGRHHNFPIFPSLLFMPLGLLRLSFGDLIFMHLALVDRKAILLYEANVAVTAKEGFLRGRHVFGMTDQML